MDDRFDCRFFTADKTEKVRDTYHTFPDQFFGMSCFTGKWIYTVFPAIYYRYAIFDSPYFLLGRKENRGHEVGI